MNTLVVFAPYVQIREWPDVSSTVPALNVAPASCPASSAVMIWHGSMSVGTALARLGSGPLGSPDSDGAGVSVALADGGGTTATAIDGGTTAPMG